MSKRGIRRSAHWPIHTIRCVMAVVLALLAGPADAGSVDGTVRFRIEAGMLADALDAWSRQSGLQVLYAPEPVGRRRSARIDASLTPARALAELLDGSGLTAVRVNARTWVLRETGKRAMRTAAPAEIDVDAPSRELAPVYVTGSHLPRDTLLAPTPVIVIDREQIEASGASSLFDLLRTRPGVNGLHPVQTAFDGGTTSVPAGAAAAVSLDALGPRGTLILVDGHRLPSYGLSTGYGALIDLDTIPIGMVDRVEILRGGSSAIYGADAIAGVINIVLRRDVPRPELSLQQGISSRGDAATRRLAASGAFDLAHDARLYLAIDRFDRDRLPGDARDWHGDDRSRLGLPDDRYEIGSLDDPWSFCSAPASLHDGRCLLDENRQSDLQPALDASTLHARLDASPGSGVHGHLDVRASRSNHHIRSAPYTFYLNSGPRYTSYAALDIGPVTDTVRHDITNVVAGLDGTLGGWRWDVSLRHGLSRVESRVTGVIRLSTFVDALDEGEYVAGEYNGDPALIARIAPAVSQTGRSRQDELRLDLHRDLGNLRGGPVRLALGMGTRIERLATSPDELLANDDIALGYQVMDRALDQEAHSLYGELVLPLRDNLEVEFAARIDRIPPFGNELSPRAGFLWTPLPALTLRGSSGRGYRAPSLYERRAPFTYSFGTWTPQPDGVACLHSPFDGWCEVDIVPSENAALAPETSRSHTLGAVWSIGSASLSLDRFRIDRRNEIVQNDYLNAWQFPDANLYDEDGRLHGFAFRYDNLARTRIEGWSLDLGYVRALRAGGRLRLDVSAGYLDRLERQADPFVSGIDAIGHDAPRFSIAGSLIWQQGDWSAALTMQHRGRMRAWNAGGTCPDEQVRTGRCHDPAATLFGTRVGWSGWKDWTVSLAVNNLTDVQPQRYGYRSGGYDRGLDDPLGRFFTVGATRRF